MNDVRLTKGQPSSRFTNFLRQYGALIGMVVVLIVFQFIDKRFFNPKNILGVLNSSTFLILLSLGIMMTMAVRGIDLSVAQVADASGVIVAMLILKGYPIPCAILIAVGFGLAVGLINCIIISYLGVPAIIGTLGMMFIIRSIELSLTNGAQPQILFTLSPRRIGAFNFIGQGHFGPITVLMILCAILCIVFYFLKERSVLGRHMDAVQGNVRASILSSIDVRLVFGLAFVFSSIICAIVGVMLVSRSGNAVPRGVETYLTDCFVAVYVGTLFSKNRRFNVIGTIIGALFVGFLSNFFTLIGFGAALKNLFNGIFIILAVALSVLQNNKR
ncbi:ABC transporter permease [Treponema primitia]|uniref:ABC transporter permease n=1 Tax=Treponema primitia TaxID=88058 RepID=UPI0039815335